jgi:hypothetical protein
MDKLSDTLRRRQRRSANSSSGAASSTRTGPCRWGVMNRVFQEDVSSCVICGGRMELRAVVIGVAEGQGSLDGGAFSAARNCA